MQRRSLWAKGVLAWFAWRRGRYGREDVRLRAVEKCVGGAPPRWRVTRPWGWGQRLNCCHGRDARRWSVPRCSNHL